MYTEGLSFKNQLDKLKGETKTYRYHCGKSKTQRKWFLDEKRDGLVDENRINNEQKEQELSHDSIARLNCALPITKTISVIR